MAILIALVVSISVDAAWAAPVRTVKAFAASACCAARCARLAAVVCDNGCCPVTSSPDSPVIQRAGERDYTVATSIADAPISPVVAAFAPCGAVAQSERSGSDPPLFLRSHTLRL
ncbi:MAG: hypothetical protein ABW298_12165 [Candidatus Binatia bacterium]